MGYDIVENKRNQKRSKHCRMSTEKKSNRKEWVKNAAIVFLSIMLVLTFFSNTIMNYSLPEVATAMIEPGSIQAKIRGTGNLTSEEAYKIEIQESRKIASVAVKQGDVVEKDQALFYLEDVESAELEEAQKVLDDMLLAYSSNILTGDISAESYQKIQSGKISSNGEYQSQIDEAKMKVEFTTQIVDEFNRQIKLVQNGNTDIMDTNAELNRAKQQVEELNNKKAEAKIARDEKKAELEKYTTLDINTDVLNSKLDLAVLDEGVKRTDFLKAKEIFYSAINRNSNEAFEENAGNINYIAELAERAKEEDRRSGNISGNDLTNKNATQKLKDLQDAYDAYVKAKNARKSAEDEIKKAGSDGDKIDKLQDELEKLENTYKQAEAEYKLQEEYVKQLTTIINDSGTNNEKHLANLNAELINATIAKEQAEEELAQLLKDINNELSLGNQNSAIRKQREKVEKLRKEAVGTVITAPMAGTITTINKIAGESTAPGEELAIMQPEGKGFTMSFSVTPEQAKKVTVGEMAEIQNSWYYNDIKATLIGIRPDPESNGTKRLLVFNVEGDVQEGQSISLSIGQKSASYDLVVPNSAVREDNNGKFILIVEAKNSPLGNRYMATRVDVDVLGTDDTKTAINAPLYGYEFVITTATQPVEAGTQVRLAEN